MTQTPRIGRKKMVILGGGFAGTMMANKFAKALDLDEWSITVVDRDNTHVYQPGLLFLPFGMYRANDIKRPRNALMPPGVDFLVQPVEQVDVDARKVVLEGGGTLEYDILILATGTRTAPEDTPGLKGEQWYRSIYDFYTMEGAVRLGNHLADFDGGTLVLNVVDMPIKCPVAPLEFVFLADAFFTERGIRDKVKIIYATPLSGAFTKPKASAALGDLLRRKNIELVPDFALDRVDEAGRKLVGYDGTELAFDTLVTIPLHHGMDAIKRSGLGDDFGFVPTDKHTLQVVGHPEIFALGDGTNLPTSKAGSVAHFEGEVLIENVLRFIDGRPLVPDFDGHANCFIETGHGKAVLIDFNYTTEPLPGKFPLPGFGPFTLLGESYTNHWGKLGFRWVYWHLLAKGEELPLDHRMLMHGKWS